MRATYKPLDFEFFLNLERVIPSYEGHCTEAPRLLKAWCEEFLREEDQKHLYTHVSVSGAMFLFNAGMICGIRSERARRKAKNQ